MNLFFKGLSKFILCLLAAVINGYFFNYINDQYFHFSANENGLSGFSEQSKIFLIVIAAPIVETFIFNFLPNRLLRKFGINNILLLIVVPSVLFSLFHLYHPVYAMMAFLGGMIMNWYYIHSSDKKIMAFLLVTLLHSVYNLYGYPLALRYKSNIFN